MLKTVIASGRLLLIITAHCYTVYRLKSLTIKFHDTLYLAYCYLSSLCAFNMNLWKITKTPTKMFRQECNKYIWRQFVCQDWYSS